MSLGRCHRAAVAAVRVAPRAGRAGGRRLQRVLRRVLHRQPVGAVERLSDLAADEGAEGCAHAGGDQLAAALADLGAGDTRRTDGAFSA